MNTPKIFFLVFAVFFCTVANAQQGMQVIKNNPSTVRVLTIEPGIGLHTNFGMDLLFINLVQWNPHKRLSIASHSSFNINNPTQRYFNYIKTNYNYSINQKLGVGTTLYTKKGSHTFLLMAGAKYTTFKETLDSEHFDKVSKSIKAFSPDYGMMYSLKKGRKNCFFSFRMYVPLYPWPTKGSNVLFLDGNMNNISLEFGAGIKIK